MASIKHLVENKTKLQYDELSAAVIEQFAVKEKVNWESLLPTAQQQELFGGEILRLVADHPKFTNQKDIRPISLMRGSISQLLFFFVRLNDEALNKAQIQKVTTRFIRGSEANRYIIWFFGNKNETELKVVLSAKEGKKVVLKTLSFGINQPYYKTYNFIFTEVQAKVNRLFVEPTDLWKTLWKAFDISIVNRNFYNEIKGAYEQLIAQLSRKGNPFRTDEDRVQFAIRLIGRIIFCWFLKRKEVLKEDALSLQAVKAHEKANYYQDLLEPLFFDVLNTPEKERKGGLPKTIARYPFLNGGLFEAQETDYRNNLQLHIENKWFEDFFGNTLERYNFTVDENSSSNEEIAIDPEMLGRIFENLLAEQNPETGESARKATGSFYTPREIVDYMVEQSIAEYLKTSLALPETMNEVLEDFVHTQHLPEQLEKHEKQLSDALVKIKVLDPACGSGAFPIGVLQKVVALKQQLHPKSKNYKLKLDTIQNSIYGVDIQPMAVELSRLRCWLSLVVDEEPTDIKALPNLDFKFVCADTLVDVPEDEYVKNQSGDILKEFAEAIEQYFNSEHKQKTGVKNRIRQCLNEITAIHDKAINQIIERLRKERNSASAGRLKQLEKSLEDYSKQQAIWHSYRNLFENKKVDFFKPEYFFPSVKNGFDIVIGNPPYVQIQKLNEEVKTSLERQKYKTFTKGGDLYQLFYERGIQILHPGGHLCFITSNKWMRTDYGYITREYFGNQCHVKEVIDFGMALVFESATTLTNIIVLQKAPPQPLLKICRIGNDFTQNPYLPHYVANNAILINHPQANSWIAYDKNSYHLIQKIINQGKQLKDWDIEINYGIKTGCNEAFIIDAEVRDKLIAEDPKSAEMIKPILRGEDIKAYVPDWKGKWLIATHNGIKAKGVKPIDVKKDYKAVYKWLLKFQIALEKRQDKGDHWTNLRNCAYIEEFSKPKIIYPNMTKFLPFVYDKGSFFTNQKCFIIT
ncbi:MAG: N-6 DNA methylase [Chitinophagales bacterium]